MPDGDGIIRGKVDHRFCHEETEDLTLSGILSAKAPNILGAIFALEKQGLTLRSQVMPESTVQKRRSKLL